MTRFLTGDAAARRVSSDEAGFVLRRAIRKLTPTEVKTLGTGTGLTIVPKVAGKSIAPVRAVLAKPASADVYAGPTNLDLKYRGAAGSIFTANATLLTGAGAVTRIYCPEYEDIDAAPNTDLVLLANAAVTGAGAALPSVTVVLYYHEVESVF